MDPRTIANRYYDAWRLRGGDMSGVPLADDFAFTGPVASFDSADGYRAMAEQAGAAVTSFRVRHQFAEGDLVCSVIDWEMSMVPGVLTAAEVLEVRAGTIVRGELIYDAEELRRAMARPRAGRREPAQAEVVRPESAEASGPDVVALLARGFRDTAGVIAGIENNRWDAPSPCTEWTVRQVGNHLAASIALLTRVVEGEPVDAAEFDPGKLDDVDHLGPDPAEAFRSVAERALSAFARPGALDARFPYPAPDVPGQVLANLCLLESLVHGWDIARGAGVGYQPDDAVVAMVRGFTAAAIGDRERERGMFGPALPTEPGADPFTATLAHLGRGV
jgi:uncharacterized protein (TIGR03086 family)